MESDNNNPPNLKSSVIRVLHIDDEDDFLFLTKEFVEKMSEGEISVESLQNPMEVFEKIKDDNIDVIVCDYLMEDLNGLDLLKQIKQKEMQIPFIIFTGRGREEVVIDALNLGADYYIRKGSDAKSQYTELVHQIRTAHRHKIAEQALVESEKIIKRERGLTEHYLNEANVMFVIVNKDEILELVNKEVTKVLGYSEKDLIGKNWFTSAYPSEIVNELRFSFQQVMTGMKKPTPYSELEIKTKTGEKRLIAWHNTIIFDEDEQISKFLAIGDDITKKKEIEEALQQSEEQYRKLVDTAPFSIVLADLKGNITFANQQAAIMHGVEKPEELIGCSMMEFTAPDDQQRVLERMRKQMFSTLKGSFEYTLLRKNGERFLTEMNASVIADKANKPVAIMAIARDLTESREAEKALKESEEKYRGFVQNFDGIAFRGSVDFKPFFFHGAVEEITGYSEEDFIKGDLSWDRLVLPEDMEKLLSIRENLESTVGFSNTMDYRIKNKNDEIRWIRQHIQNIGSSEEEDFIVQGSLYDITERKLFEENLQESELKFKSLFEGIPDAVFVANPETQTIVDCNKQAEFLLGCPREDIISKNIIELHPEDLRNQILDNFEKHVKGIEEIFETEIISCDDKRIPVSINASVISIKGKEYLQGIFRDITETKIKDEELSRSETRYRRLVETSPDGIVLTDLEGRIILANNQALDLIGVTELKELQGVNYQSFVPQEEQERALSNTKKVFELGVLREQKYSLLKKDGTIFYADVNVSRIDDAAGNPIALMSVIRDITKRREVEEKQKQSEMLYKIVFESTGTSNMIIDVDKVIKMINSRFEELTDYARDEIENRMKWSDFLSDEEISRFEKLQELHFENPKLAPDKFETYITTKDGSKKDVLITVNTIPESTDFIVTLTDISKMKEVENQLEETANLYKTLFEATGTANAIARGEDAIVEKINDRLEELSGYSKEEIEGKMTWHTFVHESELERLLEYNSKRMQDPSSVPPRYDVKLTDKNGDIHDCLIHIGVIPNTQKFIISIIDISDSKKAEVKLKGSESLYRTLFEATGTGNAIIREDTTIELINNKLVEDIGYSKEELEGKLKWDTFVAEGELERLIEYNKKRMQDPSSVPSRYETKVKTKDNRIIDVLLHIEIIPDTRKLFVSMLDISDSRKAEEELKESEALYRTLFEITGTSNAIINEDSIVELVNNQLAEVSGYSKEEIEGKLSWHTFVAEEELERIIEYNRKRMQDPSSVPSKYETKLKTKDNRILDGLIHIGIIPNTRKIMLSMIEITETKRVQRELLKSVELYKTIFEAKGTANMIVGPGRIIKEVNSKLEEIAGYQREDLIGRNWTDFVHDSEKDNLLEYSQSRRIEPQNVPLYYETSFINRKGDIRNVMVNLTTIPLSEDYIVSLFDVTEMKEAEEEIKRSELLYRSLFENTGLANIIFDLEASIVLVNSRMEKLSGYTRKELEGRKWTEFIPKPELEFMLEYNRKRMLQPESVPDQYETRFITKNGTIMSILIAVTSLPDSNTFLASVVDISESSKLMDTLTKQKKELTDFVHLMGHDIRNSLSSIEGYTDLLNEGEEQKEMILDRINNQTEYLRKLLNRSIELAEAGQVVEKSEKVNLNELVETIGNVTIPENIKLAHDPLVVVKADKEKLSQIIKNLFENAVIHGQPTQINVRSKLLDEDTALLIENDGTRVDPKIVKEAFESTFTTKEKESIHGLTIVKKLIDAHGWKIRLLDKQEKACFEILIPKEDVAE